MNHFFRLLFLSFMLVNFTVSSAAAFPSISIGQFESANNSTEVAFSSLLIKALKGHGFDCVTNSTSEDQGRYTVNGVLEVKGKKTSYSAILSDGFNLAPDLFFKGIQKGGSNLKPAAQKLAESISDRLKFEAISRIEINGNFRLTPGAVLALSEIHPGEKYDVSKIIAARLILENCGLFSSVRLFLKPDNHGNALHINVEESHMLSGKEVDTSGYISSKETLIKNSQYPLPSFRIIPASTNSTCYSEKNAFEAEELISRLEIATSQEDTVKQLKKMITVAEKLRQAVFYSEKDRRSNSIILMKLCSILNSDKINNLEGYFRKQLKQARSEEEVDRVVNLTGLFDRSAEIAARIQEIIGSRLYLEKPHAPFSPMLLQSLGDIAMKQGNSAQAEDLYQMAVKSSGLPVSIPLLISLAESRYRNLHGLAGDQILEILQPLKLSSDAELTAKDKTRIANLPYLSDLCVKAASVTDDGDFNAQLIKGHALISLHRPDLAEPLFQDLHGRHPDDARPFTGFARLAVLRSGNLSSAKTYVEKSKDLKNKDSMYYELALGYVLDRIVNEALPALKTAGRDSEQAAAALYLLPDALDYAKGYTELNPASASAIDAGLNVLKDWLSYPEMPASKAFETLLMRYEDLRKTYPLSTDCAASSLYSSIFITYSNTTTTQKNSRLTSVMALPANADQSLKILRLNTLIRRINLAPDSEQAKNLVSAVQSIAPDYSDRGRTIAAQADGFALAGIYLKDSTMLNKAISLYSMAVDFNTPPEKARILNNLAVAMNLNGKQEEAEDLLNESMDFGTNFHEVAASNNQFIQNEKDPSKNSLKSLPQNTRQISPESYDSNSSKPAVPLLNARAGEKSDRALFAELDEKATFKPQYDQFGKLKFSFQYKASPWLSLELITTQGEKTGETGLETGTDTAKD